MIKTARMDDNSESHLIASDSIGRYLNLPLDQSLNFKFSLSGGWSVKSGCDKYYKLDAGENSVI